MEQTENEKTLVVFFSSDSKFKLPESSILLPVSLNRNGLSEIINSILNVTKQFDFIIEGKFLKSSLKQYLEQNSLSLENTTRIEVVESEQAPELQQSLEQDDWISVLRINQNGLILSGSFDSMVTITDIHGTQKATLKNSRFAIKSASWLTSDMLVVGDNQSNITGYSLKNDELNKCFTAVGHVGSIDSIASHNDLFASGSFDKSIKLFNYKNELNEAVSRKTTKKQKVEKSILNPTSTLIGHNDVVSGLEFHNNQLYSCSWDHSIRIWDLETLANLKTLVKIY